jgi:hypothetical protein
MKKQVEDWLSLADKDIAAAELILRESELTGDAYYNPTNMDVLRQSMREAEEGRFVTRTLDELQAREQ